MGNGRISDEGRSGRKTEAHTTRRDRLDNYPSGLPEPNQGIEKPSRDPINMLVSRPVADVFKHFCRIERYRYHEALEEIMKRAGLLPRNFGGSA